MKKLVIFLIIICSCGQWVIASDDAPKSYEAWYELVKEKVEANDMLEAVDQLHAMKDTAIKGNDALGMAQVYRSYGYIYYTFSMAESLKNLEKALEYLTADSLSQYRAPIYHLMALAALDEDKYDQALGFAAQMAENADDNEYVRQSAYVIKLYANAEMGNRDKAKEYYQLLNDYRKADKIEPQLRSDAAVAMSLYLCAFGNPDEVLALLPEIEYDRDAYYVQVVYQQAKGNYAKAFEVQQKLDQIYWARIDQEEQAQVAMANAAYNNQQLEAEKHVLQIENMRSNHQRNILAMLVLIVVIALGLLVYHQLRILKKNKELVMRIKAQEVAEETIQELTKSCAAPQQVATPEQKLFARINDFIADEAVLSNTDLNRDLIATELGTNRTYVAQAIAACADGMSVSEYIARHRVQKARQMIEHEPEMSLDEISEAVGFSTRSYFHSVFSKTYQMTPGQFRKALR